MTIHPKSKLTDYYNQNKFWCQLTKFSHVFWTIKSCIFISSFNSNWIEPKPCFSFHSTSFTSHPTICFWLAYPRTIFFMLAVIKIPQIYFSNSPFERIFRGRWENENSVFIIAKFAHQVTIILRYGFSIVLTEIHLHNNLIHFIGMRFLISNM
jgi:hypothetical protein